MKKILIIDSDVDFLNMMKGELEAAGYEVVVAQDAATGLAMTEGVSLIILAVELPDQNGFVVCSLLKRDAMTADTPVFITSSAETTEAFEKHLNLANHADGYFLKPVDVNALFQEMEALFEDQRLMQEATSAACDEMIDVNAGAIDENEAADNEVIKALSDEDMSLFGEIDSKDLMGPVDEDLFDAPETPAAAAVPPVPAAPATPSVQIPVPSSSVSRTVAAPPRPGSNMRSSSLPTVGARASAAPSPIGKPSVPPKLGPTNTLTGMSPVAPTTNASSIGLPRTPLSAGLQGSRQVKENKPFSGKPLSSVSQMAIPAADMSRMSDEITVLKNEVTALKSEITARDNRITMLQSQCDALNTRCQKAEAISEALKNEAEEALSKQNETEFNSHAQIEELKASLDHALAEVDRLRGLIAEFGTVAQQLITSAAV